MIVAPLAILVILIIDPPSNYLPGWLPCHIHPAKWLFCWEPSDRHRRQGPSIFLQRLACRWVDLNEFGNIPKNYWMCPKQSQKWIVVGSMIFFEFYFVQLFMEIISQVTQYTTWLPLAVPAEEPALLPKTKERRRSSLRSRWPWCRRRWPRWSQKGRWMARRRVSILHCLRMIVYVKLFNKYLTM